MALPVALIARVAAASALALAAAPLAAEPWRQLPSTKVDAQPSVERRLDLGSLKQDGDLLTYRVEMTTPANPTRPRRVFVSTSVVDCRTNQRRHVATETVAADGTVTQRPGMNVWRTIAAHEVATGIIADYCKPAAASATN